MEMNETTNITVMLWKNLVHCELLDCEMILPVVTGGASQLPHHVGESLALNAAVSGPASEVGGPAVCEGHPAVSLDRLSELPGPVPHQSHHDLIVVLVVAVALVPHRNVPADDPSRLGDANKFYKCSG